MRLITPLIIKFIMITAVAWVVLRIYGASFGDILIAGILLTGLSFIVDVYVLPKVGNLTTLIVDFGLAFIMIWLIGLILIEQPNRLGIVSFIAAFILMFGEMGFHKYMSELVLKEGNAKTYNNEVGRARQMQTEFGSEFDIKRPAEDTSQQTKNEE